MVNLNRVIISTAMVALSLFSCAPQQKETNVQEIQLSPNSDSIIGGQISAENFGKENGIVGLLDLQTGNSCTGSLLPNNIILTAAHCVSNPKYTLAIFHNDMEKIIELLINQKSPDLTAQVVRLVDGGAINPQYLRSNEEVDKLIEKELNGRKVDQLTDAEKQEIIGKVQEVKDHGDIALLHYTGTTPEGYKVAKTMSPAENLLITNGAEATLAGYGWDNGVERSGTSILRDVSGIKVSNNRFARTEIEVDQRQGKGACHGDSGGPAYLTVNGELKLWGVTSRGYKDPNDHCSEFAIYTNINTWTSWIKSTSEDLVKQANKKANAPAVKNMLLRKQAQR